MAVEINGDERLSVAQRLKYLARNFLRNLPKGKPGIRHQRFHAERQRRTPATASPSRALTEAFLYRNLPRMLPPGKLRVLEIGCGSGSLTRILAELGYSGSYVGIDIDDRFDRTPQPGFDKTFVHADVRGFEPGKGGADLVISVSALEHIPEDLQLTSRLAGFVAPGGQQLHFVPSAWGLPVYLWHGYRQYSLASIAERFDSRKVLVFAMGGAATFLLHFLIITVGEILVPLRLRQRMPGVYGRLLDWCLQLDRLAPACATMHAVCLPAER